MLLRGLRRLIGRVGSLDRADHSTDRRRPDSNTDAAATSASADATVDGAELPLNYVRSYDDGRPRK